MPLHEWSAKIVRFIIIIIIIIIPNAEWKISLCWNQDRIQYGIELAVSSVFALWFRAYTVHRRATECKQFTNDWLRCTCSIHKENEMAMQYYYYCYLTCEKWMRRRLADEPAGRHTQYIYIYVYATQHAFHSHWNQNRNIKQFVTTLNIATANTRPW